MSVSLVGVGAFNAATTTALAAAPAGDASDTIIAFLGNKPYTSNPTDADYTSLGTITSGLVANGNGTGSVRCTAFQRTVPTSSATSDSFANTGGSPTMARAARFARTGEAWEVAYVGLNDTNETGTAVSASATLGAFGQFTVGDMVAIAAVIKDDVPNHTSQALTIPGCTLGAITWDAKGTTTSGNDGAMYTGYAEVVAGSSTAGGTITYTATSSVSGAAATAVSVVRLRSKSAGAPVAGRFYASDTNRSTSGAGTVEKAMSRSTTPGNTTADHTDSTLASTITHQYRSDRAHTSATWPTTGWGAGIYLSAAGPSDSLTVSLHRADSAGNIYAFSGASVTLTAGINTGGVYEWTDVAWADVNNGGAADDTVVLRVAHNSAVAVSVRFDDTRTYVVNAGLTEPPAGENYTGDAAFSGSGTLAASAPLPGVVQSGALSGAGALVASAPVPGTVGTAALSGEGTLVGTAMEAYSGSAEFSATSGLTVMPAPGMSGGANLSGSGALKARLGLAEFQAKLVNGRESARVNIGLIGASLMEGWPATEDLTPAQFLAAKLRTAYPTSGAPAGFGHLGMPTPVYSMHKWSIVQTGTGGYIGTSNATSGWGAKHQTTFFTVTALPVIWRLTITDLGAPWTSFDLDTIRSSVYSATGGKYRIDGGAWQTFSLAAGVGAVAEKIHFAEAVNNTIDFSIDPAASGSYVILNGVTGYAGDESKGIQCHGFGHSGYKVSQWRASTNPGYDYRHTQHDQDLDLLLFSDLGVNDAQSITAAAFRTELLAWLPELLQVHTDVPMMMVIPWDLSSSVSYVEPWANYVAVMEEVAAAYGMEVLNLQGVIPPPPNAVYHTDNVHTNTAGDLSELIAQAMFDAITPAVQAETGAAGFSGEGTLTAAGGPAVGGSAEFSGSGSLTTMPGVPSPVQSAGLSGEGTLTTSAVPSPVAGAALSGEGTLITGAAVPKPVASAALSGSGTLSTGGSPALAQTAALSGSGTLTAGGAPTPVGAVALSGTGTLTTGAVPSPVAAAALSGEGTLTVGTTTPSPVAAGALSGEGTLTTSATPTPMAAVALSGSGTLTTAAVVAFGGTAGLSGDGQLTVSGPVLEVAGLAVLSGEGQLLGAGASEGAGVGALSGTGTLTATAGGLGAAGSVALSGSGELVGSAAPGFARAGILSAEGTLTSNGSASAAGTANLGGTGTLSAAVAVSTGGAASLSGDGTLTALGGTQGAGFVALSGDGTLTAAAVIAAAGLAALSGTGELTAGGGPNVLGTVTLAGAGTLLATVLVDLVDAAGLTGEGTLTTEPDLTAATGLVGFTSEGTLVAAGEGTIAGVGSAAFSATGFLDAFQTWIAMFSAEGTLSFVVISRYVRPTGTVADPSPTSRIATRPARGHVTTRGISGRLMSGGASGRLG